MGGRLLDGPTMVGRTSDWKEELGRFLRPFSDRLGHKARRQMCPLYVSGLIGPGDRKSIQPMAERLGFVEYNMNRNPEFPSKQRNTSELPLRDRLVFGPIPNSGPLM